MTVEGFGLNTIPVCLWTFDDTKLEQCFWRFESPLMGRVIMDNYVRIFPVIIRTASQPCLRCNDASFSVSHLSSSDDNDYGNYNDDGNGKVVTLVVFFFRANDGIYISFLFFHPKWLWVFNDLAFVFPSIPTALSRPQFFNDGNFLWQNKAKESAQKSFRQFGESVNERLWKTLSANLMPLIVN